MQQIRVDNQSITGLMIESHMQAGSQELNGQELRYGVSIPDAGIGQEKTEKSANTLAPRNGPALLIRPTSVEATDTKNSTRSRSKYDRSYL